MRAIKFKHKVKIRTKNIFILGMLIQVQYFVTLHEICCNIFLKHVTTTNKQIHENKSNKKLPNFKIWGLTVRKSTKFSQK